MNAPATRSTNRLARETSPYLLQHAHNPVDWYPWGEEAFAKARAEDKPILLSVGYATCHWCHVMERESFEDEAIARQLRAGFVAIKVDREELPDVDHVYMSALQALTGRGGWPMNMFLTPQLKPFFGGSYFPPADRYGLLSFSGVLSAVREAWKTRRAEVEQQADALLTHVREGTIAAPRRPADRLHEQALTRLARQFDERHGGFGAAPKFPQSPLLQYLLTLAAMGEERARTMLATTLAEMAAGGMLDQVGGGFARYSTDERWHVPHFEKMLYDNAQLARIYAGAYRLTGDERLRFVAEDTLAWLRREMHPAAAPAAFSSAQDADSEGVEGKFYVWTAAEFHEVLGADAGPAARLYGVTEEGNWEHGLNVLERRDPEAVRSALGLDAGFVAAVGAVGAGAAVCGPLAAHLADHRRQGARRLERHGAAGVRRSRPLARPRRLRRNRALACAFPARRDGERRPAAPQLARRHTARRGLSIRSRAGRARPPRTARCDR